MTKNILLLNNLNKFSSLIPESEYHHHFFSQNSVTCEVGLRYILRERPEIIVISFDTAEFESITLLQEIKSQFPEIEVIITVELHHMDYAVKSLMCGASDYILEPLTRDAVDVCIRRAFEKIAQRKDIKEKSEDGSSYFNYRIDQAIKAERLAGISQLVEGLGSFVKNLSGTLNSDTKYINEMPCFISVHDNNCKVVTTNQLYRERLGNGIGMNSWDIYKYSSDAKRSCPVYRTIESGAAVHAEEIIINRFSIHRPVNVHTLPIYNRRGEVELVIEMSADIREIKRLTGDLKVSQEKYRQLFNGAPCFIYVQDHEYHILEANRNFKEYFGDHKGEYCFGICKNRDEPCRKCSVMDTFRTGKSHASEAEIISSDGIKMTILRWTSPVFDSEGDVERVLVMFTDITEFRRLENHLSSLGFMIGSISHGIKGLLTGLDGGLYLLDSGVSSSNLEKITEGLEISRQMIDRIKKLVMDILYYTKSRDLEWETVPVADFISDTASVVKSLMKNNRIRFEYEDKTPMGTIEIDKNTLGAAMVNILENAIDACVEDREKNDHSILFSAEEGPEGNIVFTLSDNGMGMDRATLKNMFTMFYSSKGNKGTGLGLFIANKVIKQHGGEIFVESTPGEGSDIRIILPIRLPEVKKRSMQAMN